MLPMTNALAYCPRKKGFTVKVLHSITNVLAYRRY